MPSMPINVLLMTILAAAPAPTRSACRTEVVAPATGPRVDALVAWLAAHSWEGAHLLDEGRFRGDARIADIDNEGAEEYVLSAVEGSGSYLSLWVFRPAGEGYAPVPVPDDLEGAREYGDLVTRESRLVERFCGLTYLNLSAAGASTSGKASYLWRGGTLRRACGTEWLREQRRQFQALFDRKQYRAARPLLEGLGVCAGEPDPELWLWLQSDAALAAQRVGTHGECMDLVDDARKSPAYARGSAAVRRALDANNASCRQSRDRLRTRAGQDFSWLLELESDPERQFVLDDRFEALLTSIVPDVRIEGDRLLDDLRLNLWLPQGTRVLGRRYVVLLGCRPHDCETKGFAWVDVVGKRSAVYTLGHLASTTFVAHEVPQEVWAQLAETIGPPEGTELVFVDAQGRTSPVVVPKTE
jgi:hypothetical protein